MPSPGGLSSRDPPVERADAVGEPAQARAGRHVGAADAVVGDLDRRPTGPPLRTATAGGRRARVLRHVGQRLRPPRSRPRSRPPAAALRVAPRPTTGTGARSARARSAARSPRSVRIAGWMPARQLAQLVERGLQLGARLVEQRRRLRRPLHLHPRQLELQRQRHQPRLRAVVQVALEPPPLGVAGLDQPRPRGAQLLDPRPQLRLQPLVLERQRRRRAGGAHELRLVVERRVVGDRGDPAALHLDRRPPRPRHRHRMPERVDVALGLRQPVRQRQRRVAERVGQRRPQRALARRLARPARSARPPPRPWARRLRSRPTRNPNGMVATSACESTSSASLGAPAASNPLASRNAAAATPRRPQHRPPGAVAGPRALTPDDDHPARDDQDERHRELHRVQRVRERLVALDDQQVARLTRLLEQQRRELQHGHGEVRAERPPGARRASAGGPSGTRPAGGRAPRGTARRARSRS